MITNNEYKDMCVYTHGITLLKAEYHNWTNSLLTALLMCAIAYDMIERGDY